MQQIVSPLVPFPNVSWWLLVSGGKEVVFDQAEHFVKMTYRNRYYITGANGLIQLTVPLAHGRNQRTAMQNVQIDNKERWQVQHWRTLFSVYGRAPYFEHFAPSLEKLFNQKFDNLIAFNHASVHWLKKEAGISFEETIATEFKQYESPAIDIRNSFKPGVEKNPLAEEAGIYYQLFSERNGFYPNLSLLDILFSEGPAVKPILAQHQAAIQQWLR